MLTQIVLKLIVPFRGHGLTTVHNITVDFSNNARDSANGTYPVTVVDSSTFNFNTTAPLDVKRFCRRT